MRSKQYEELEHVISAKEPACRQAGIISAALTLPAYRRPGSTTIKVERAVNITAEALTVSGKLLATL